MRIEDEAAADVIRRLRRVEGQVGGIVRMLEAGRDCADIVTQLSAASHALHRAGFRILSSGMRQCATAASEGRAEQMTAEQMEKLFLALG